MRKYFKFLTFLSLFLILSIGCQATNPKIVTYEDFKDGRCPFVEFIHLKDVSHRQYEACFVNGREGAVSESENGRFGTIDGCNQHWCGKDENGKHVLVSTLMGCGDYPRLCLYKGWILSRCFKFIDEEGVKKECRGGEIAELAAKH